LVIFLDTFGLLSARGKLIAPASRFCPEDKTLAAPHLRRIWTGFTYPAAKVLTLVIFFDTFGFLSVRGKFGVLPAAGLILAEFIIV